MAPPRRKVPSWKAKSGAGNRNTRRRTIRNEGIEPARRRTTRNNEIKPGAEPTELVTKSRYLKTTVLGRGEMRTLSRRWVQLGSDQGLILKTDPLENMVDQVHNIIIMYGNHHKDDAKKCPPNYENLLQAFKSHIKQPDWWFPNFPFSHYEYLIRGHQDGKATTPKFAHKVTDKVPRQCSNLMLEKKKPDCILEENA